MKYLLFTIFSVCVSIASFAQNISVSSFTLDEMDLTANTEGTIVLDQNGDKCALIKVQTTQEGFTFDIGTLGVQKTIQKVGEIWVYVPGGARKMTIQHAKLGVLRDYNFPIAIQKAKTYIMKLTAANVRTIVEQDAGGNFLTMKITPTDASLYIDGQIQQHETNGEYSIFLGYGKHTYRIEAASYSTEEGTVEIGDNVVSKTISLTSTLASVSISCPTEGAEIYVNKKLKGTNSWQGQLSAGRYLIEAKKAGYQITLENVQVAEKENKAITLQALQPIYGMLKVNVKPVGSTIEIDGKPMGTTPAVLKNIIIGNHNVKITATNGNEINKNVEIKENEMVAWEDVIPEMTAKQLVDLANEAANSGNQAKEFEYACKAANTGDPLGQYRLAGCYYTGSGVPQNYSMAIEWYTKSADQGFGMAQTNLGTCYYYGYGVAIDYTKAAVLFAKAANQGLDLAQYYLAYCYYYGQGVEEDKNKARYYYQLAANQGNEGAKDALEKFFLNSTQNQKNGVCTFSVNGVSFDMIKVNGGKFVMGATFEQGNDSEQNEKPKHEVKLSDYYISKYEVTQELWQAVMANNPSYYKDNSLPVENISWNDCQKFVQELSALTGKKFRLPTEAEWEFAARGGKAISSYKYSGSNELNNIAWYWSNSNRRPHSVGTKQPNELGIYDMSGNVEEWCNDYFHEYTDNSTTDPTGGDFGLLHVYRGGSCDKTQRNCRVSSRHGEAPAYSSNYIGMRLALTVN